MIETYMRRHVEQYLDILGGWCAWLHPDVITLLSFMFGVSAAIFLALGYIYVALIALWLSGLADCLDGIVARLRKKAHIMGTFIDLISDRLVESAVMIGFSFFAPEYHRSYLYFMCALLFHFSTFVVSAALFENHSRKSVHYAPSIVERIDAFCVMSLMMLLPEYIPLLANSLSLIITLSATYRFYQAYIFFRPNCPHNTRRTT